jgi:outer membrane protein
MKLIYKIIIIAAIAAILSLLVYQQFTKPKTAYVDLTKLYDGFECKIELEKKLITVQEARQNILDSLELELKLMVTQMKTDATTDTSKLSKFTDLKEEYLTKKEQYETDNEETSTLYTTQIWKQLNQYVQNYGKKNNYTYIFGAEGSGAIMYANSSEEITEDVLIYINEEYNGSTTKNTDASE